MTILWRQDALILDKLAREFIQYALCLLMKLFYPAGLMEKLELLELIITNNFGKSIMLIKMELPQLPWATTLSSLYPVDKKERYVSGKSDQES